MDDAGGRLILVSMGTTARLGGEGAGRRRKGDEKKEPGRADPPPSSPAPAHATAMAAALNALAPIPILWKVSDADLTAATPLASLNLGPHITPRPWLPQNALLQSGGVAVFVAHGGVNGVHEAAFHGVPLVGVPLFGDGGDSAAKAAAKGFGVTIGVNGLQRGGGRLEAAIRRAASDPALRSAARALSTRLRSRRRPARVVAASLVEGAARAWWEGRGVEAEFAAVRARRAARGRGPRAAAAAGDGEGLEEGAAVQ